MGSSKEISLNIPADSDYISVARLAISGIASKLNFTVDDIEDVKIAVSEACTNVIQHAYNADKKGGIHIGCSVNDKALEITVKDTGCGFDVENTTSKKHEDDEHEEFGLGLGLTFIKTLMDDTVFLSQVGQGSSVKMTKLVPVGA